MSLQYAQHEPSATLPDELDEIEVRGVRRQERRPDAEGIRMRQGSQGPVCPGAVQHDR